MQALWADGWFYISSAGLLVSGVLFFFLLGQYRAASEAVDGAEPDAAPAHVETTVDPVKPVRVADEPPAPARVSSVPHDAPAPAPAPTATATPSSVKESTGGFSPAVLYLQTIQVNLEKLHAEVRELSAKVNGITSRDEALIERLGELNAAVADLKNAAPVAAAEPRRKAEPKAAPKPAPEPIPTLELESKPAPAPEAKPEPAAVAKTEPAPAAEVAPAPAPEIERSSAPAPKRAKKSAAIFEPSPEAEPEAVPAPKAEIALEVPLTPKTEPAAEPIRADETVRLEPGALEAVLRPAPAASDAPSQPPAQEPESETPRRGPVWPV